LGQNLGSALRAAWESDEGQQLRRELSTGLSALERSLRSAAADLSAGETGQRLKGEVEDFGQRVRSGQVESQLRSDLLSALRAVNTELTKAGRRATPPEGSA